VWCSREVDEPPVGVASAELDSLGVWGLRTLFWPVNCGYARHAAGLYFVDEPVEDLSSLDTDVGEVAGGAGGMGGRLCRAR
jgi:hypothetical protein